MPSALALLLLPLLGCVADGHAEDPASQIGAIQRGQLSGALTLTASVTSPEGAKGFFVRDDFGPYNGIWVYTGGTKAGVGPGDVVRVAGVVKEFHDLTELDVSQGKVERLGPGPDPVPTRVHIDQLLVERDAEAWESVLITVDDLTVTNANPDGPKEDFGEFEVAGGLRVDDLFHDGEGRAGERFVSITGVLTYGFGHFKLCPRSAADLQRP